MHLFSHLNSTGKGVLLIATPLIFEIVFVCFVGATLLQSSRQIEQLAVAHAVLLEANHIESEIVLGILALTRETHTDAEHLHTINHLLDVIGKGGKNSAFNAEAVPALGSDVAELIQLKGIFIRELLKLQKVIGNSSIPTESRGREFSQNELLTVIMASGDLSHRVVTLESQLNSVQLEEMAYWQNTIATALTVGVLSGIVLTLLLAAFMSRNIIRRIHLISNNMLLIAADKPLPDVVEGSDEIAAVDRALHHASILLNEAMRKQTVILENSADIICSLDARLRFLVVGGATLRMWNYHSDDLRGLALASLIPSKQVEETLTQLRKIIEEQSEGIVEIVVKTATGIERDMQWTVRWSKEQEALVCVVHDVTEIRQLERLKKQFLAMVSHDLRAPLTSIGISLSFMQRLQEKEPNEKILNTLTRTLTSQARLVELVNQLLELEKLEAGKMKLDLACVSIADVCAVAVESLEVMTAAASVKIVGPYGDAAILADEGRLIQVMTNLISNAVKFSPADTTVKLGLDQEEGFVRIWVKDNGPGIGQEFIPKLFSKFSQAKSSTRLKIKSTGLGLSIVKAIIDAHGGEVGVDSEIGKGSTFWLKLPHFEEEEEEGQQEQEQQE